MTEETEMLDKNGLTEEEFLASYNPAKYERPSVTVDIICIRGGKMLLIRRGGHPFIGKYALPGGFCEPHENVYEAAARELFEETGLKAQNLIQLPCFSDPDRDPRTRIITVPFITDCPLGNEHAGDDAGDAKWYSFSRKDIKVSDSVLSEIFFNNGETRFSVKVSKIKDETGTIGDPLYKVIENRFIAGDHPCVICCALDHLSL